MLMSFVNLWMLMSFVKLTTIALLSDGRLLKICILNLKVFNAVISIEATLFCPCLTLLTYADGGISAQGSLLHGMESLFVCMVPFRLYLHTLLAFAEFARASSSTA